VDLVARRRGDKSPSFPLLDNVPVVFPLQLQYPGDYTYHVGSFGVTLEQARVLDFARRSGCEIEVRRPRTTGNRAVTAEDYKRRLKLLREWITAGLPPQVAPQPRWKGLMPPPEGMEIVSAEFAGGGTAGWVAPASRVDVLAAVRLGNKLRTFPLVDNVSVTAVTMSTLNPPDRNATLYFVVTPDQAALLELAKGRGCQLDVLLRAPDKSATTTNEEYKKRLKFLQELPEVAPAPRLKSE
jgi:hypothetical protein